MDIPAQAIRALDILESQGHRAYLVGGCVRDDLLGLTPGDWDICTSARPEQTEAAFAGCRLIETGLRHGTVTVLLDGLPLEITTLRRDGAYTDGRHPDAVCFTAALEEDLARRDFTCNAMARSRDGTLTDPFGGAADLRRGLLRCVGDPARRFREDALRLLRALRFAARFGFAVEPETARALHENRALLGRVSAERVLAELRALLCAPGAEGVLREFADVLFVALPELQPLRGCPQAPENQRWDAWEHTLRALSAVPPEPVLRLTMLLHDCGKPDTARWVDGVRRFPGHPARSRELAAAALQRLRCDNAARDAVLTLILLHDSIPPRTLADARRELAELGEQRDRQLYAVRLADAAAHGTPRGEERLAQVRAGLALLEQALAEGGCLTLGELAVDGRALLALGFSPGPAVGRALRALLDAVLAGELPNEPAALLGRAKALLDGEG